MQTQNQTSMTRKTVYGMMLLGIFLSAFGSRNLSSANAQETSTNTSISTDDLKSYTDPKFGYSLQYPSDWSVEPPLAVGYGGMSTFTIADAKIEFGMMPEGKPLDVALENWLYENYPQGSSFPKNYEHLGSYDVLLVDLTNTPSSSLSAYLSSGTHIMFGTLYNANSKTITDFKTMLSTLDFGISALDISDASGTVGALSYPVGGFPNTPPGTLPLAQSFNLMLPFTGAYPITQGDQNGPVTHWCDQGHSSSYVNCGAIDFGMTEGSLILATDDGSIVFQGSDNPTESGFGYYILVRHNNGLTSAYTHLSAFAFTCNTSPCNITVKKGDVIGYSGHSGSGTANHLHFGVTKLGLDGLYQPVSILYLNGLSWNGSPSNPTWQNNRYGTGTNSWIVCPGSLNEVDITVMADCGNQSPNTPTLQSPGIDSQHSSTPQLCWTNNGDPENDAIVFIVSYWGTVNDGGYTSNTCWTPPNLPVGSYSWNVRARDEHGAESGASPVWNFNITQSQNQSPNIPTLLNPSPGSTHTTTPQLCWTNNGDPENDAIVFIVSYWGTVNDGVWTSNTCWTPPNLPVGNYNWNVRARDEHGAESGASPVWNFNITQSQNQSPNIPTLLNPSPGSTHTTTPQLCWTNNGDPENDAIVFIVSYWGTVNDGVWTSNTCWTPPNLPVGSYSWNIRARDEHGAESGASSNWTFSITSQGGTGVNCDQVSYNGVVLYEQANCNRDAGGVTKAFSSPTGWIDIVSDPIHDKTSSIYIAPGWSVKVYEAATFDFYNGFYGGSWRCITGSMWNLGVDYYTNINTSQIINETISSVQVYNNGTCSNTAVDILYNGGFEKGTTSPTLWNPDAWQMPRSTFTWDTVQVHSGSRSVKISNNTTNDARWIQTVYVQLNSDYRLSGWIKTENISQSPAGRGANLSYGTFLNTPILSGTNDWTYVFVDFNTGSSTQLIIAARLGMDSGDITGTAWFDDVKLELLSTPICYILTKNVNPSGSGSVTANPSPNCNNGTQYVHGTVVTLTATPNTDYSFISWTGATVPNDNPTTITITGNKSVSANFLQGTYQLSVNKTGTGSGTVTSSPAGINCGTDCSENYANNTTVNLTATPVTGSTFAGWSGACSGTGSCVVNMTSVKSATASFSQTSIQNPQWKILVLIYTSTDFTYNDSLGQHHAIASMTQSEIDRANAAANLFIATDIPALTSGYMIPLLTIRYPNHPLTALDPVCGYWPSRTNTNADLDPAFDSVIVIWDDSGTDQITGQPADLNGCGGLAISNGTGQTYSTFPIDSVASNQRNVFKHEWGHSILFYFEAAGITPNPSVDNHINDTNNKYVHCSSGVPYILQDETDDNPIPNSIYNNSSGFTHDYYSGTTAQPSDPSLCLGINSVVWSYGGPVTKPPPNSHPTVISSVRANVNPNASTSVNFTVTFSEPVTGVDTGDFSLATTGISGASITGVSGSGSTYTVTVNTGSGNGTIRLDVVDNDSIVDSAGNPLGGTGAGNGDFTAGETYTVTRVYTRVYNLFLPLILR